MSKSRQRSILSQSCSVGLQSIAIPDDPLARVQAASRSLRITAEQRRKRIIQSARDDQSKDPGAYPPERANHGVIVEGDVIIAGAKKIRFVQTPLARYAARKSITARQKTAGERLAQDYQLGVLLARDPEKRGSSGKGSPISEAQIMAATAYRRAIQSLGPRLSAIIFAVCCAEATVEGLADQRQQDRKQIMGVFKIGLDHLGDHYGDAPEVITEELPELQVKITYRHEADGTVTSIKLGRVYWNQSFPHIGALKLAARNMLLDSGPLVVFAHSTSRDVAQNQVAS